MRKVGSRDEEGGRKLRGRLGRGKRDEGTGKAMIGKAGGKDGVG